MEVDASSSEEEENPFEVFAMTQASQDLDVNVEVNSRIIQRDVVNEDEVDPEELEQQRHNKDAKHHAEEGQKFRATQAQARDGDMTDEYEDEEIDELFRRTVTGGLASGSTTPRKRGVNGSVTPSTVTSRSGASVENRRWMREQRMREEAGLGDLRWDSSTLQSAQLIIRSTIMDHSSITLSPYDNPFDERLRTPTKIKTPVSDKATPTSLVRNLFARNRSNSVTPTKSPFKQAAYPPAKTIVLPPTRKSLAEWSDDEDDLFARDDSPTPAERKQNRHVKQPSSPSVAKPKLEDLDSKPKAPIGIPLPPPQRLLPAQSSKSTASGSDASSLSHGKRRELESPSPTLRNEPSPTAIPVSKAAEVDRAEGRAKKRVRMASATPPSQANGHDDSRSMRVSGSGTLTSTPSVANEGSGSALLSTLSLTAWQPRRPPPLARDIVNSVEPSGIPMVVYQEPYYSDPSDVPPRAKMFAGRKFTLKGSAITDLSEFEFSAPRSRGWLKTKRFEAGRARFGWEYGIPPPWRKKVVQSCEREDAEALASCEL